MNEGLIRDFNIAALDIFDQIIWKLNGSHFLIYGHSMGANLALCVTSMLEKTKKFPQCLIVSGNPGPGIVKDEQRYLFDWEELVKELRDLGGISDELFENREVLDFFEPILRADFEISEKSKLETGVLVNTPIYAMMGSDEKKVGAIANWGKFTNSRFKYEIVAGGHFFIYDNGEKIAKTIKYTYDNCTLLQHQSANE